jgi:cell division septation protein DedD
MSDEQVTLPDDGPEDEPDASPAEPPAPPPDPEARCAECDTPIAPDQQYCLECGAPTPGAPSIRRRVGPAVVLAVGLLAFGIGAGALAYAGLNDDDGDAGPAGTTGGIPTITTLPTLPTTTFVPTDVTTPTGVTTFPTFPTVPTDTGTVPTTPTDPTTPTTTPTTPTVPTTGAAQDDWPGGDGFTVILASTTSPDDAVAFRDRVQATGRSAGLIESSLYATLEPDFWVVYSGVYTTREQALSQAEALRRTYPGAYAARIEPA